MVLPEGSAPSDRALELVDLAKHLKLTRLQAGFVLALAVDPKRNQTKAAIEAGASPKTAHIWASKTLRLAKIQEFLAKVTEAATERARELALANPAVHQVEEAVMESAEHQLRLSRMGRADIGRHLDAEAINALGIPGLKLDAAHTETIREIAWEHVVGTGGMATTRVRIKVADPVPALQGLARLKGWEKADGGGEVNKQALAILGAVTVEAFKAAYLKLIAGGNGHGGPDQG